VSPIDRDSEEKRDHETVLKINQSQVKEDTENKIIGSGAANILFDDDVPTKPEARVPMGFVGVGSQMAA
jgi:hypothetical protein